MGVKPRGGSTPLSRIPWRETGACRDPAGHVGRFLPDSRNGPGVAGLSEIRRVLGSSSTHPTPVATRARVPEAGERQDAEKTNVTPAEFTGRVHAHRAPRRRQHHRAADQHPAAGGRHRPSACPRQRLHAEPASARRRRQHLRRGQRRPPAERPGRPASREPEPDHLALRHPRPPGPPVRRHRLPDRRLRLPEPGHPDAPADPRQRRHVLRQRRRPAARVVLGLPQHVQRLLDRPRPLHGRARRHRHPRGHLLLPLAAQRP